MYRMSERIEVMDYQTDRCILGEVVDVPFGIVEIGCVAEVGEEEEDIEIGREQID